MAEHQVGFLALANAEADPRIRLRAERTLGRDASARRQ
jgi:hypothetical protein